LEMEKSEMHKTKKTLQKRMGHSPSNELLLKDWVHSILPVAIILVGGTP